MPDVKQLDVTQLLKEAFEAGMAAAAAYEFGTYVVDFKRWSKDNEEDISKLDGLYNWAWQYREELKSTNVFHKYQGIINQLDKLL